MKKNIRDEVDRLHDYGIYLPTRTIYIGSEESNDEDESGVDAKMAERAIKNLHILDSIASDQPINIIMNNIGGDYHHGMAIFDAISTCKNHVKVVGTGSVMSMGAIIMQAADERVMMPHAVFMMHYGHHALSGHPKNIEKWVAASKKDAKWMEELFYEKIIQKKPKFSKINMKERLTHDTILSAKEALEYNLIDSIYGE